MSTKKANLKPKEPENRYHFDYLCEHDHSSGKPSLDWLISEPFAYTISSKKGSLALQAGIASLESGASPVDHFIWDDFVANSEDKAKAGDWCETLTLWSNVIEFNLMAFGKANNGTPAKIKNTYFSSPEAKLMENHHKFWESITFANAASDSITPEKLQKLKPTDLSGVIAWNRFELTSSGPDANGVFLLELNRWHAIAWDPFREVTQSIPIPSKYLNTNSPIPKIPRQEPKRGEALAARASWTYKAILDSYDWYAGCGAQMKTNLKTLASLLADPSLGVVLVTGEPGTGKEAYCRALYFSDKMSRLPHSKRQAFFVRTTAPELSNAGKGKRPQTPSAFLKQQLCIAVLDAKAIEAQEKHAEAEAGVEAAKAGNLLDEAEEAEEREKAAKAAADEAKDQAAKARLPGFKPGAGDGSQADNPVIFIDELNKAEDTLLGALLRPLEQGKEELDTITNPTFILAASQHIEDLARKPPQDFWTRVSHLFRVAHPLSRVSEDDAESYLSAFFYSLWWSFLKKTISPMSSQEGGDLVSCLLGTVSNQKRKTKDDEEMELLEFTPSDLCRQIHNQFMNALVPLVTRDTLTVRGARSILSQAFARVAWYERFENPRKNLTPPSPDPEQDKKDEEAKKAEDEKRRMKISRLVSSAIQDVLVILNSARSTPASLDEKGSTD